MVGECLPEEVTYHEYVVLDSAGRLQVPREHLERFGIGGRAELEAVDDGILIRPVPSAMLNAVEPLRESAGQATTSGAPGQQGQGCLIHIPLLSLLFLSPYESTLILSDNTLTFQLGHSRRTSGQPRLSLRKTGMPAASAALMRAATHSLCGLTASSPVMAPMMIHSTHPGM